MIYTKDQVSMAMMSMSYDDLDVHYKGIVIQLSNSLTDSKLSTVLTCMGILNRDTNPYPTDKYYLIIAARLHEGLQLIDEENEQ